MRALLPLGFLIVVVGATGFALREHSRRVDIEQELTTASETRRRLESDAAALQTRIATSRATEQQLRQQLEDVRRKTTKAGPESARKAAPAPINALRQALLNDPQLQSLQLAAVQPKFESTYRPFFEELKLTPDQVRDFLKIIFKRYEQEMDLGAVRELQASASSDPVFAKMKQQFTAETASALTTLLGADGYRRFSDYERTVPAREFIDQAAGACAVAGAAITSPQADALSQIISAASPAYQRGTTIELRTTDWDQVLTNAKSVLGDSQLAVFRLGVIQLHNMEKIRSLATR